MLFKINIIVYMF